MQVVPNSSSAARGVDAPRSLAAWKGGRATAAMLASALINVALLVQSHIGVNADVYSTLDLGGAAAAPAPAPGSNACASGKDAEIWEGTVKSAGNTSAADIEAAWDAMANGVRACPYLEADSLKSVRNDVLFYLSVAGISGKPVSHLLTEQWGISTSCADCWAAAAQCNLNTCVDKCISKVTNGFCPLADAAEDAACLKCVDDNCFPALEQCSGLTHIGIPQTSNKCAAPSPALAPTTKPRANVSVTVTGQCFDVRAKQANESRVREELKKWTLYNNFEITFVKAVQKAIEGGAYTLGYLIAGASGVWPYTKTSLMMLCWFYPMTAARRGYGLLWLARLGRWSLVDVYSVIVLIVGLRIDKTLPTGGPLSTRSASNVSIYCFAIAALQALLQGEYMRYCNRELSRESGLHSSAGGGGLDVKRFALLLCTIGAFMGYYIGMISPVCTVTLGGVCATFDGPNKATYTGIGVGLALTDSCQLGGFGEIFLSAIFMLTAVIAPFLTLAGFLFFVAVPQALVTRAPSLARFFLILGNFACLDVFFISMLVLVREFEGLIESSLGKEVDKICPAGLGNMPCIKFVGTLEHGCKAIAGATLFMWAAMGCARLVNDATVSPVSKNTIKPTN